MAGDWIKFETATLDKPEVTLFAELLGLPVDQGVGLLVRFWVWLDRNSRHGDVTHVSRLSIDTVMHTPGFGAALEVVGWAQFDDKARSMHMPNFDRHNGSSAKTRALAKDRKANERSRISHAKPVTREEKRRSNTPIVPDGFAAFWLIYPRKDKKATALQAWKRLAPDGALQNRIAADVRRRTASLDWTKEGGTFIPHPASYLNSRRWEDQGVSMPEQPKRVQL